MNREIKFRAWDKIEKTWRPHKGWFGDLDFCDCEIVNKMFKQAQEENIVIMQFTGLLDKNGKEIYEGDIIKQSQGGEPVIVKWHEGRYIVHPIGYGDEIRLVAVQLLNYPSEIIGNIYENPELKE